MVVSELIIWHSDMVKNTSNLRLPADKRTRVENNRKRNPVAERQTSVTYHQRCHPVRAPCAGGLLEFCDDGRCECRPYAQYSDLTGACLACPRAGVACAQCCAAYGHRCIDEQCVNCHDDGQTGPSGAGCRRT